jgi:hypothetical protein
VLGQDWRAAEPDRASVEHRRGIGEACGLVLDYKRGDFERPFRGRERCRLTATWAPGQVEESGGARTKSGWCLRATLRNLGAVTLATPEPARPVAAAYETGPSPPAPTAVPEARLLLSTPFSVDRHGHRCPGEQPPVAGTRARTRGPTAMSHGREISRSLPRNSGDCQC